MGRKESNQTKIKQEKMSEYDQEMPQSQIKDQPNGTMRKRVKKHIHIEAGT